MGNQTDQTSALQSALTGQSLSYFLRQQLKDYLTGFEIHCNQIEIKSFQKHLSAKGSCEFSQLYIKQAVLQED
jgi:hypothetical protein